MLEIWRGVSTVAIIMGLIFVPRDWILAQKHNTNLKHFRLIIHASQVVACEVAFLSYKERLEKHNLAFSPPRQSGKSSC